jgi:hypothetical protein
MRADLRAGPGMMKLLVIFRNYMKAPKSQKMQNSVIHVCAYFKKRNSAADVLTFLLFITRSTMCSFLSCIQLLLNRMTEDLLPSLTDTLGAVRHWLT